MPNAISANVPGEGTVANSSTIGVLGLHAFTEWIFAFSLQPCGGLAKAVVDPASKIIAKILIMVITPLLQISLRCP